MAVSIILCTYNDGHFLPNAIRSCLQQGIEVEIVLVDDCSTEPLVPEVRSLIEQHGIRYVRHGTNIGLSASRNTGIAMARNEWVIPLDADDWFYPNAIKTLCEMREGCDIVTGNCTEIGVYAPAIAREPLSVELFKRENPLVCSSLFKKAIWAKTGGYMVRKGPHYEDWNFWARCFKEGATFKYLPFCIYHHTLREGSMLRVLQPKSGFYRRLATRGVFGKREARPKRRTSKKKVGLLVIATNKYIRFVEPLWTSAKKFFLSGTPHQVSMFVFTNMPTVPDGIIRIQHEHTPWPGPTLMRYHAFIQNESVLEGMDYLFCCDADMRFEGKVGEEVLGELVATRHPGFWDKPYALFSRSYEKRPQSLAYMPPGYGNAYYAGGFNGGKTGRYLQMAREIKGWIDEDLSNGMVAVWHDESYVNKYLAGNPPTVALTPAYCYQEELSMPFPRKLVALKKDHRQLRT